MGSCLLAGGQSVVCVRWTSKQTNMEALRVFVLLSCFAVAVFTDPPCVIELECAECLPENMPLVTSHRAVGGAVTVPPGEELVLACSGGRFLAYPLRDSVAAVCEQGRLRVRHDHALRHLLDLGCQENIFEDVLHEVEGCGAPLQGRAYQVQSGSGGGATHLATLCFDTDRGLAARAHSCSAPHNALPLRAHPHAPAGPLSLLGNFNHMFDARTRAAAERLYGDDERMNRRLRELLKHDRFSFADQTLTSAKLLSPHYFDDQNMRVTDFVSNKVAAWRSVVAGNLAHVQRDVGALVQAVRRGAVLHVHAGTHGVSSVRAGKDERRELYLAPGRFPVPKYIWTVVHDEQTAKAVAIVVLNDPFVAVSEIRAAIFCDSACSTLGWLQRLRRAHNYETPLYGLVFCCNIHDFTARVTELPKDNFRNIPLGKDGLLTEFFA